MATKKAPTKDSISVEVLWLGKNDQYIVKVPVDIFEQELDNKEFEGYYRLALPQSYTLTVNKGDTVELDNSQFWVSSNEEGKWGKIANLESSREAEAKARVKAKNADKDFNSKSVLELAEMFDADKLSAILSYKAVLKKEQSKAAVMAELP